MKNIADILEIWINDAALDRQQVALIEGMQKDESFWQDLFANYTRGKIELAFPLDYKGQMGKSAFLPYYELLPQFSGRFVICRDSDNEHLYNEESKKLFLQPFLYHTYTYNIENHKCTARNLTKILREITSERYDIEINFFERFNAIIHPLLVIILWLKKQETALVSDIKAKRLAGKEVYIEKRKADILTTSYNEKVLLDLLKYEKQELNDYFIGLSQKIAGFQQKIKTELINNVFFANETLLNKELSNIISHFATQIPVEESYLYLQGHVLYDNVICPLLTQIKDTIVSKKYEEIKLVSPQKASEYRNKAHEVNIKTRLDVSYKECFIVSSACPFIQKIGNDIQTDFPN